MIASSYNCSHIILSKKRCRRGFWMYCNFQYNYNPGYRSWTSMNLLVNDLWIEDICLSIFFSKDSPYKLTLSRFYSIMCNHLYSAKIISQEEFHCRGIRPWRSGQYSIAHGEVIGSSLSTSCPLCVFLNKSSTFKAYVAQPTFSMLS